MQNGKRKSIVLASIVTVLGAAALMNGSPDAKRAISDTAPVDVSALTTIQATPVLLLADGLSPMSNTIELPTAKPAKQEKQDTPLLSANLDVTTQWAIYEACDRDNQLFCTVMAIAWKESLYQTDAIGDGGSSIGMMQINTRWNAERIERLGVTDLTDPAQNAKVAIDYLQELSTAYGSKFGSHEIAILYNVGPSGGQRIIREGCNTTEYSREVMQIYQSYMEEMEAKK